MAKDFAKAFYSSKRWQACRNEYAKQKKHLCERCLERGLFVPGAIVHHIRELTPQNIDDPNISLSFDNLQLVCRECHAEIHDQRGRWAKVNEARRAERQEKNRYRVDENGKIFPNTPLISQK